MGDIFIKLAIIISNLLFNLIFCNFYKIITLLFLLLLVLKYMLYIF